MIVHNFGDFDNCVLLHCSQMTVESVKDKLWRKCGTSVNSMCLELYDDTGAKISVLSDNLRPLGFYSPQDGLVYLTYLMEVWQIRLLFVWIILLLLSDRFQMSFYLLILQISPMASIQLLIWLLTLLEVRIWQEPFRACING